MNMNMNKYPMPVALVLIVWWGSQLGVYNKLELDCLIGQNVPTYIHTFLHMAAYML